MLRNIIKYIKRCAVIVTALAVMTAFPASAAGNAGNKGAESGAEEMLDGIAAAAVYAGETSTGTAVCEREPDKVLPMGHLAKLMTVLICAGELESGGLSLPDTVTVSAGANAMPSPQIWLSKGERVTVEELLKAVTMGNANDACYALAEKLSGSAEKHIARMNEKARALGMEDTCFADCCGLDGGTVSTAADIYRMSREIMRYDMLTPYFTAWIDHAGGQGAELVNTNVLVRSCKGVMGLKACGNADGSWSIVLAVRRGGMPVCTVLLGVPGKDDSFASARRLTEGIFEGYRVYEPEADEEYLADIPVTNGRKHAVRVRAAGQNGVLLRRGEAAGGKEKAELPESVPAPVREGDLLGRVVYPAGEGSVTLEICAAETVEKMDIWYGIYLCLCNLFNI